MLKLSDEMMNLINSQPEEDRATWFAFYVWLKSMPKLKRKEIISRVQLIMLAVKLNPDTRDEALETMYKEYPILRNIPIK